MKFIIFLTFSIKNNHSICNILPLSYSLFRNADTHYLIHFHIVNRNCRPLHNLLRNVYTSLPSPTFLHIKSLFCIFLLHHLIICNILYIVDTIAHTFSTTAITPVAFLVLIKLIMPITTIIKYIFCSKITLTYFLFYCNILLMYLQRTCN